MAKSKVNNGLFSVGDLAATTKKNIEERHTQGAQYTHDTHDTQRKQKHPRINMAFYGDNLEYVREAAYQKRVSVTEYINQLIVDDRNRKLAGLDDVAGLKQLSIDDVE